MVWALKEAPVPNDPVAHLVLIAYADHAKDDGTAAWPSVATVAKYARCTTRTVHTKLRLLVEWGLLRPGDQRLVDHRPANRRPVVYDLVMRTGPVEPVVALDDPADAPSETPGQAGVKILHPRTAPHMPVENPTPGVNRASPQNPAAVDNQPSGVNQASPHPVENPDPGVKQASPHRSGWGEAGRASGVKLSSHKPSLEPSKKNQGLRESGTSPAVIHRPADRRPEGRADLCLAHRGSRVPPPCRDCAAVRAESDSAHHPGYDPCPHGDPRGATKCALCRRGLLPGVAPWDATPPTGDPSVFVPRTPGPVAELPPRRVQQPSVSPPVQSRRTGGSR